MENPIKMDDLGGKPTIFGNTHEELITLPETTSSHLQMGHPKRKFIFQPLIFQAPC